MIVQIAAWIIVIVFGIPLILWTVAAVAEISRRISGRRSKPVGRYDDPLLHPNVNTIATDNQPRDREWNPEDEI
jgi:hypothetical protein